MADELTRNYLLLCPKSVDTMSQQLSPATPNLVQNIRDAFERFEVAANPIVVTSLPQAGNYNVGDRVYLNLAPYNSTFILYSKNPFWGWVWRPIYSGIAPWTTVPTAAFNGPTSVGWSVHATNPLQFALDNKGNCRWRGAIKFSSVGLGTSTSWNIFATLPIGLRHHTSGFYGLAIDPATPQTDTGIGAFKSARLYVGSDGSSSVKTFNAATAQNVYFDNIQYPCSVAYYYEP